MRVSFVWLNHDAPVGFSHGLALLSAELKAAGHVVNLVHVSEQLGLPFEPERIVERLREQQPDLVGLSFGSNHALAASILARAVRRRLPGVWLITGGIHSTLHPEQVLSWPEVDLVAVGEVDDLRLVEALEDLERGRLPHGRRGFWFRERGRMVKNPIAPPVDLSRSRPMDLMLFDHHQILAHKRGWADVHAGRGCPGRCSYCFNEPLRRRYQAAVGSDEAGRLSYVRKRPLEVVLAELEQYQRLYGSAIRVFSFTDDQFITSRRWLFEFLEAYRARFRIPLVFLSSATRIDGEVARRCAQAGVYMVRLGVESGSARIRTEVLGRRIPGATIRRAVRTLQAAGVNALAFQMLGIPGETTRELWQTFRLSARLEVDAVKFSLFWPYPGTSLHRFCQARHLIRPGLELVGNNTSESPLIWKAPRERLLRRLPQFYDLALNRFGASSAASSYQQLLGELSRMPEADWRNGGAGLLRQQVDVLNQKLIESGELVYVAPFADRQDIVLLQGRQRTRPLML